MRLLPARRSGLLSALCVTPVVAFAQAINTPPVVEAGPDQALDWPANATLAAVVSDDGLPGDPAVLTIEWGVISGPGTVVFEDPASSGTAAAFSLPGIYVLNLTAHDGELSANDTLTVALQAPPVVDAGEANYSILQSWALPLIGQVSDEGLPVPPGATTVSWTLLDGPAPVSFDDPASAVTSARFPMAGDYTLQLMADDGAGQARDTVMVRVNDPPIAEAGPHRIAVLGTGVELSGSFADDGAPDPPGTITVTWSAMDEPESVIIAAPDMLATSADFLQPGSHRLRLTVSDGELAAHDNVVIFVDNAYAGGGDSTVTLSWVPPTEHVDGTPLDDLAGFRIRFGRVQDGFIFVETFADPALASLTIPGLTPGTWQFQLSAYTTHFIESDPHPEAILSVPVDLENADSDGDSVGDLYDNCPYVANGAGLTDPGDEGIAQRDTDGDGAGDACDDDDDNDGVIDSDELTNGTNRLTADTDADGVGDLVDQFPSDPSSAGLAGDIDGSGIVDVRDIILLQRALFGGVSLDPGAAFRADVYPPAGDGRHDLSDWVVLQTIAAPRY